MRASQRTSCCPSATPPTAACRRPHHHLGSSIEHGVALLIEPRRRPLLRAPHRVAADTAALHLVLPRASQAPRLMRCHWRHCAGAAAAVDISPAAILPSAQLLCIFSCFSIANLGPTLDPAAYTSPRRSNWHASLSSRSCVASLSTKLRLPCTASPTYPCQSKLCAVSASVSL